MHDAVSFVCNICDRANLVPRAGLTREAPTCGGCGSSVRLRALVHLLSRGLFGRSLALHDFPHDRGLRGLGLGDAAVVAAGLAARLGYANLEDGRGPWHDGRPRIEDASLDFVIASDLLQLVAPPVQRAFDDLRRWLRPGGLLVLTAPFDPQAGTREHYPELHDYAIVEEAGRRRLYKTRRDGRREAHDDLVFHGGSGARLEMRLFGLRDLLGHCADAGFRDAGVQADEVPERGIVWLHPWSVPIVARA